MSYFINALGEQQWDLNSEFTDEERQLVDAADITVPELRVYIALQPVQSLETAIGGLVMLKKGWGQPRVEPVAPVKGEDASV